MRKRGSGSASLPSLLALLVTTSLLLAGIPIAAADGAAVVSVTPETTDVTLGEDVTIDVLVENADSIGAFTASVAVDDPEIATVVGVEAAGTPMVGSDDPIATDGSSAELDVAYGDDALEAGGASTTVATITVEAVSTGTTTVSATIEAIGARDGSSYAVDTDSADSTITVETDETFGTLAGAITDGEEPIANAEIELVEHEGFGDLTEVDDGFTTTASTDTDGTYEINVPAGFYKMWVNHPHFEEEYRQNIEIVAGETNAYDDIEMTEYGGLVSGAVTDADTGDPIEGVEVVSRFYVENVYSTTTTDEDGEYEVGVPDGQTVTIEYRADGYETATISADGSASENILLSPESPPTELGTLTGTVTDASVDDGTTEPVSGAAVGVLSAGDIVGSTTAGQDGTFVVDLNPGTYDLAVAAEGYEGTVVQSVEIVSGQTTARSVSLSPNDGGPVVEPTPEPTPMPTPTPEPDSSSGSSSGTQQPAPEPAFFDVAIDDDTSPILAGDTLDVTLTVENTGESDGSDTVELLVNGEVVDSSSVSLDAGDSETISLSWSTGDDDAGEYAVEVRTGDTTDAIDVIVGDASANVSVVSAAVNSTEAVTGESVLVTATVRNVGTVAGIGSVGVEIDGEPTDERSVDLDPNATRELSFTHAFAASGTYEVTVEGVAAGTVTVTDAEPADIIVFGGSADREELSPGETVTVTGDLYNRGGVVGNETISLDIDGEIVDETTVELSPGIERGAVELRWTPSADDLLDEQESHDVELRLNLLTIDTVRLDPAYANITVISASASDDEVVQGEELHVTGSIYNAGTIEGTEEIELTATDRGTGEPAVVGSQEVTLASDFYHLGALNISFAPDEAGTYDLELGDRNAGTIEVEPAVSNIQVISASTSEIDIIEGETTSVVGSVYQAGNVDGTETIELRATREVDGGEDVTEVVGSQEVTLAPGFYHLGAINVTWGPDSGYYDLQLGSQDAGWVDVEPAVSDIEVIAASASAVEIIEGEELYVTGSLYQNGTIDETEDIELTATNQETSETTVVGSQEVSLAPDFYHLGALNITFTPEEAGTYDLELGNRSAGTVEVAPAISDIEVVAASASKVELIQGEELYVTGSLYQDGNIDGPEDVELRATNRETGETTVVGSQEVTLAPGFYHLGALNITFAPDEAGTYDLDLGDRNAGSIEVRPAISDIEVVAAGLNDVEIMQNEATHVTGSIYQNGTVDGPEEIELTATNQETGETEVVGSQEVTLAPGFYHLGALNITFTPEEAGTFDLALGDRNAGTIEVEPAASDIEVVAASASAVEIIEGEEMFVTGSIYQAGNADGPQTIDLTATNRETGETEVVGSQEVTLAPGFYHLGALNITFTPEEAGTFDLALGDRDAGMIAVEEAITNITVVAAAVSDAEIVQGETTQVTGSVYQGGNVEGTEEIELTATHRGTGETTAVGSQDVTLAPGFYHVGAISVQFAPDVAGTYDLQLGGRNAGTIEVEPAVSDIEVISASASAVELIEGEELSVTGSLYQNGTVEGPEEIELTATNQETGETEVVGSQEVTLAPGFYHLGALNITFTPEEAGTYDLELGDRNAGTIEVRPAVSDIEVVSASPGDVELIEGKETYVVGSVYQNGTIDGPEEIELTATNQETGETTVVGTQDVTLASGFYHLGALNISFAPEAGTFDLALGDRNAGTIEVEPAASDIEVVAATPGDVEITLGEETYVTGSVYQNGTVEGSETVELTATHRGTGEPAVVGSQEATLAPGFYHLGALNISFEPTLPGTYDLELGGRNAGYVEVEDIYADVSVVGASVSDVTTVVGDETHVVGDLYNAGNIPGVLEVQLEANGDVVDTESVTVGPGSYQLRGVNLSFTADETETYDFALSGRFAGSTTVSEPTVDPTVTEIHGTTTLYDPEDDVDNVYASADVPVDLVVGSDHDIDDVTVTVDSLQTTFAVEFDATPIDGDTWEATIDPDAIPDDGKYEVSVDAVDEFGYVGASVADEILVIDRDGPSMAATIEAVDSENATVRVESDEPLSETPAVSVERPDGSVGSVTVAGDATSFTGTLDFDDSGEYAVTVEGSDLAGNAGTDTASVVVNTNFTVGDGTIVNQVTGTSIDFTVADDAQQAIEEELFLAISESTVNANLDGSAVGIGFLTAELDDFLDHYLEAATIRLAVDDGALGPGVSAEDARLHHYDEDANEWDAVETTYETIDGQGFLVADVTHFSTYGALVPDDEPPVVTGASVVDGAVLDSDAGELTLRFEYDDHLSEVDVESIALTVDGTDVTGDPNTSITSSVAQYVFSVDDGETYEAILTVDDRAGNSYVHDVGFTVDGGADDSSESVSAQPSDESGLGSIWLLLVLGVFVAGGIFGYRRRVA